MNSRMAVFGFSLSLIALLAGFVILSFQEAPGLEEAETSSSRAPASEAWGVPEAEEETANATPVFEESDESYFPPPETTTEKPSPVVAAPQDNSGKEEIPRDLLDKIARLQRDLAEGKLTPEEARRRIEIVLQEGLKEYQEALKQRKWGLAEKMFARLATLGKDAGLHMKDIFISSKDPALRALSAGLMGEIFKDGENLSMAHYLRTEVFAFLRDTLANPHAPPGAKSLAHRSLGELGTTESMELLWKRYVTQGSRGPKWVERVNMAFLARGDTEVGRKFLLDKFFATANLRDKDKVASILMQMCDRALAGPLADALLRSEDPADRVLAAEILSEMLRRGRIPADSATMNLLDGTAMDTLKLLTETAPANARARLLRGEAIEALGRMGTRSATAHLVDLMNYSQDRDIQRAAALALVTNPTPESLRTLENSVIGSDLEKSMFALKVLTDYDRKQKNYEMTDRQRQTGIRTVETLLFNRSYGAAARSSALEYYVDSKGVAALQDMKRLAQSPDNDYLRSQAVNAVSRFGGREDLLWLQGVSRNDSSKEVRNAANAAAKRLEQQLARKK